MAEVKWACGINKKDPTRKSWSLTLGVDEDADRARRKADFNRGIQRIGPM